MNTNSIPVITPEAVTAQFNAWYAVAVFIGATIWHVLLKAWPSVKAVYPWIKANRGIFVIVGAFFYVPKPKPTVTGNPVTENALAPTGSTQPQPPK